MGLGARETIRRAREQLDRGDVDSVHLANYMLRDLPETRDAGLACGDLGLAKMIGGHEFKPDAHSPESQDEPDARCGVCGTRHGVAWIAGAGQFLCYRHQDDY